MTGVAAPETRRRRDEGQVTRPKPHTPAVLSPKQIASVRAGIEPRLVSLLSRSSFEAEQYRVLRHQLEQLHKKAGVRVVAVTSPAVGDGKTTTAINLAGAFAQSPDTRVLLIDADLRRPAVAAKLGMGDSGGPGLIGAILEPYEVQIAARQRPPFNLGVLPAGRAPQLPYELLRSPRLAEILEEARAEYDFVILDTPPVLLVPDCRVIERLVDGLLMVVSAHRTPRRLLGEALKVVDQTKLIGIVFNNDDRPLSGYYKRYYGYAHRDPAGPDSL
jgi:capsular exopolysaccharide synthesis family protein